MRFLKVLSGGALCAALLFASPAASRAETTVTRATLANGLQIVVVRDTLAPVVTTMLNYRVGSDQQWISGLAHATEHMMFRGSKTMSSSLFNDVMSVTGGSFDADTQNTVTQYYFTVPSQYLDVALRLERSRAAGLTMAPAQWASERGAITQEVTQDNSNALYRLFVKMQDRILAGAPYAKNGLGTVESFEKQVNSQQLLKFYHAWYHPNNAVYVIAGNVDPAAAIARVKQLFGDVPAAPLPPREPVHLQPLHSAVYHDVSDQSYTAVLLGYRFPGYDSPDYAASQILGDVLSNQRSAFGALGFEGKALQTQFFVQPYPKTALGVAFTAIPVSADPAATDRGVRAIFDTYRKDGVPADLVAAAKLREISQIEFNANSIEGLADEWSQAVAVQHLSSPDDMIAQFNKVTVADVDRVLRTYLNDSTVIAAYAVPKNNGQTNSGGGQMAKENNSIPPTQHEPLPVWAQSILQHLQVPGQTLSPTDMTLSNGIRLIVQPEHITHTVVVHGAILNNPQMQEPAGQEGVADLTSGLMQWGTTTYDRVAFAGELDKIAASASPGTDFSLQVLAAHFERGVQLLADEELHPAFDPKSFGILQQETVGELRGEETAPDHLAAVALEKALYPPGDPEQRFATPQSVGALTLDDVKHWYATAYRPDMATIVVIGDTTPEQAKALFEKYFAGWTATGPKPNVYPSPVPSNAPSDVVVPATGRVQSTVRLEETLGLVRTDPSWAPLQVADAVLTGGFYSSLLYHDLREVHGYVYYVGSRFNAGKVRSTFAVEYGCGPRDILPAQSQVVAVLKDLQDHPIGSERILRSKALLMGAVPLRASSYDGAAGQLLDYAVRGLPLDQNVRDASAELSASAAAIQEAMAKYVRPDGFVRVVTGPAPQ
ncbi:MAG TPA: pitrilysin family protein [Candidatus Baltobacteraceae bacterium]|nr:pitrilysin family protein [Candidatus Baltobacteraceae bacterium]